MKIKVKRTRGQVYVVILILFLFASCIEKKEVKPVSPPLTFPLSQMHIGYGVVNVSYTRVTSSTEETSSSPGYLRLGSVVRIIERRLVRQEGKTETWVLIEGNTRGWLRESLVDIYDNEKQARTASELMSR
jgi:hypothetical protein